MTRARQRRAPALCTGLAAACLLAGCASPGAPVPEPAAAAVTFPMATSLIAVGGQTWAIVPMGGSAASQDTFWELLARPAASTRWDLVTPPGVASNGGLTAAAPATGQRLDIAFRPSQGLTFSPLARTSDGGKTWATGLIDAPVAAVPDAMAVGSGTMLALLADGGIEQAAAPGAAWKPLAAPGAIAATTAGQAYQVTSLTAVALTATGTPLAAATCARPGIAGIFARTAGTWRAAGPGVPAALAGRLVRVLRLTGTTAGDTALLQPGPLPLRPCSPPGPATEPTGRSPPRSPRGPARSPPPVPGPAARPGSCWPAAAPIWFRGRELPGGTCPPHHGGPPPWRQGQATTPSRRWPYPAPH